MTGGIYPAAITPFTPKGEIDRESLARLLAWFEASGCPGVVLAGTNGEGPSLSAWEKRDLLRAAFPLRGNLEIVAGVATPSLAEAEWLCKQASKDGASAVLLMAPFYFREATETGLADWFEQAMSASPLPVLIYNFPKRTGFTVTADLLHRLASHERFLGAKDSSGCAENLRAYRQAAGEKLLYVGNETLLMQALEEGWSGSISGAANVIPEWLSKVVGEWMEKDAEAATARFRLLLPVIEALRAGSQPALNKGILARQGIIGCSDPRLPLVPTSDEELLRAETLLRDRLGGMPNAG